MAPALAMAQAGQTGTPVANFQYWDVHVIQNGGAKVCFVASRPISSSLPEGPRRSAMLFMVTSGTNETYAQMGYPLAADSVLITVDGGQAFTMFVVDEGAWLATPVEDNLLVTAMKGGSQMVVRGTSTRGTNTTDTYSLSGITAALARAEQECD